MPATLTNYISIIQLQAENKSNFPKKNLNKMRKIIHGALILLLTVILYSCETSDREKVSYTKESQNALRELFTDTANHYKFNYLGPTDTISLLRGYQFHPPVSTESLKFIGSIQIPSLRNGFDPKKLLSTNKGTRGRAIAKFLHTENFEDYLFDNAKRIDSCRTFKLDIYQTLKNITDEGIRYETEAHPLSEVEFSTAWVYLFSKQPNGEADTLLTNGDCNVFYVDLDARATAVISADPNAYRVAAFATWNSSQDAWKLSSNVLGERKKGQLVFLRGNWIF